jgi:transcriptional regulator with XRE-family HTH domain
MFTGHQIKAARAMLGWSLGELAKRTGVSYATVHRAEAAGEKIPTVQGNNLAAIEGALTAAGVQFIDEDPTGGRGVRLARGQGAG